MIKVNKVNTIINVILLLSIFSLSPFYLKSQDIESPLMPVQIVVHDTEIGLFLGMGANFNSGVYKADCTECNFDDVSKFGYTIGLKSAYQLSKYFYISAMLGWDDQSVKGSFRRIESVPLDRADGSKINVPIEFRHTADLKLAAITLMPDLTFRYDRFLDVSLGFFSDFVVNSNFKHEKQLLTKSVVLPDGEKVSANVKDDKDGIVKLEDGELANISNPIFGLVPKVNFNIELDGGTDFNIGFFYKYPLSKVSANQDFKLQSWRIFIGLSFDLYDDSKEFGSY